jgi:hypothetical protein
MQKFLVCLALLSVDAAAQAPSVEIDTEPFGKELTAIIDNGVGTRTIPPAKRSDLRECDGSDEPGVLRAIDHCWPVLEVYRVYSKLPPAFDAWNTLPSDRRLLETPESRAVMDIADDLIARTKDRTHPAEDIPLFSAYFAKSTLLSIQGDQSRSFAYLVSSRDVMISSRIDTLRTSSLAVGLDQMVKRAGPDQQGQAGAVAPGN